MVRHNVMGSCVNVFSFATWAERVAETLQRIEAVHGYLRIADSLETVCSSSNEDDTKIPVMDLQEA